MKCIKCLKFKMSDKHLKHCFYFLLVLFLNIIISCENFIGLELLSSYTANSNTIDISGKFQTPFGTNSRAAVPSIPSTATYFATASASGREDVNGSVNETTKTFMIPGLELDVEWTITVGLKDGTNTIMSASTKKTLSIDDVVFNYDFRLQPVTSSGTGQVALTVTVPGSVSALLLTCEDSAWPVTSVTLTGDAASKTGIIQSSSVPAGDYEVTMWFKDSAAVLYCDRQTISVCANLTTSLWETSTTYELTSSQIENFCNTVIYVGRPAGIAEDAVTVSDTNSGGPYSPLASISAAANRIVALNNARDYTIYVSGTITGASTLPDTLTTSNASSVTIQGLTGLDNSDNPQDILDGEQNVSAVLTVQAKTNIFIKDLLIKNSRLTNGSGLKVFYDENCLVTLNSGVVIDNNRTGIINNGFLKIQGSKIKNNTGPGIMSSPGVESTAYDLIMEGGTIENNENHGLYLAGDTSSKAKLSFVNISNNSSSDNGGGVCVEDGAAKLELYNCQIKDNTSGGWGGGIYSFNAPLIISNTIIENNSAEDFGGGIAIFESGDDGRIELSGTTKIQNNELTGDCKGKGIYSQEAPVYIQDSVFIDSDNEVWLQILPYAQVYIKRTLNPPVGSYGITATIHPGEDEYSENTAILVLAEGAGTTLQNEYSKIKITPCNGDSNWIVDPDGKLYHGVVADDYSLNSIFEAIEAGQYGTHIKIQLRSGNVNISALKNKLTALSDSYRVGLDLYHTSGLTEITGNAFMNCVELEEIILPPSVTHINYGAFDNCSNLKSITYNYPFTNDANACYLRSNPALESIIIGPDQSTFSTYPFFFFFLILSQSTHLNLLDVYHCYTVEINQYSFSNTVEPVTIRLGPNLTLLELGNDNDHGIIYTTPEQYLFTYDGNSSKWINNNITFTWSNATWAGHDILIQCNDKTIKFTNGSPRWVEVN